MDDFVINLIHSLKELLLNNDNDPDINFFKDNISVLDAKYYLPQDLTNDLTKISQDSFSVLHLNVRSLNKNFESFKQLLCNLKFEFRIICLSETWCDDNSSSLFELPDYNLLFQNRVSRKGGGVCIYLHKSLIYKERNDLSINSDDIQSLSVEITNKTTKNIIMNAIYRPPNGDTKYVKLILKVCFLKI